MRVFVYDGFSSLVFIIACCSTLWFLEWRNDDVSLSAGVIGSCFSSVLSYIRLSITEERLNFIFTCPSSSVSVREDEGATALKGPQGLILHENGILLTIQ